MLHSCDNPPCFEDGHLSAGTESDNMQDKVRKRRDNPRQGTLHGKAALTDEEVRAIRSDTRPQKLIAELYGIQPSAVSKIKRRATWKHIP